MSSLKLGKAPGLDGYTPCYYEKFAEVLAHISIIPKEGKDHCQCQSYQLISLMNMDLKVFTKIWAPRFLPLVPWVVHMDQVGFVPGREARDYTQRVLNAIHWAQEKGRSLVLLLTDAEKAFNRVGASYALT